MDKFWRLTSEHPEPKIGEQIVVFSPGMYYMRSGTYLGNGEFVGTFKSDLRSDDYWCYLEEIKPHHQNCNVM